MKIINNLLDKMHNNYIEKVKIERDKIKEGSNEQIKGYLDSYLAHGSPLHVFFGETILGEPPIIEACIEVYGQRVTNNLYSPPN
jgi:hypothetical protein